MLDVESGEFFMPGLRIFDQFPVFPGTMNGLRS